MDPWKRPDLTDEAQRRAASFIRIMHMLILGHDFDVILAPGNSGTMMAWLAVLAYGRLGMKAPPVIRIPIRLRDRKGRRIRFDNSVLLPAIMRQLGNAPTDRVLFVDDELSEKDPRTLKEVLRLFRKAGGQAHEVFVVAEGRGPQIKGFNVKYFPFARQTKEWKGVRNFVSYAIPWSIQKRIRERYSDDVIDSKELFCILLGEPVRGLRGGRPVLSHKWEPILKRNIRGFSGLQKDFRNHLKRLAGRASA